MIAYAQDHNNHLPNAAKWEEALAPYNTEHVPVVLKSPWGKAPHRIAMNKYLSGLDLSTIPSNVILLYEKQTTEKSAHGSPNEALDASSNPAIGCVGGWTGYGHYGCGNSSDFALSSDPKAMGLTQ